MTIESNDKQIIRCPKLGSEVPFAYCRAPGREIPCGKIFDCWWNIFNINEFINKNYDKETIKKITAPPPAKTTFLLDILNNVQNDNK